MNSPSLQILVPALIREQPNSLCDHFELCCLILYRTSTHHDIKPTGLHHGLHVEIKKRKFVGCDDELNGLTFAGCERNALEILQFHHGSGYGTYQVTNVELHDLISCALTCVADSNADRGL